MVDKFTLIKGGSFPRFWIMLSNFPASAEEGKSEYVLIPKPQNVGASGPIESFTAASDEEAIQIGIRLAQDHGLYPKEG